MGKGRKRSSTKKIVVLLLILFLFAVVIGVGLYQMQSQSRPVTKKPANEYFEVLEPTVDIGEFQNPTLENGGSYQNSSILIVKGLSFKLKAVGGDANSVAVKSQGMMDPYTIYVMYQNQPEEVHLESRFGFAGLPVYKNSDGIFQYTITITSREAEGDITFLLPPE